MKAIPITKKLCTAGGGYASPAKLDPAEEEENKQTASEKKLFINE
jgi:hypothetical protein